VVECFELHAGGFMVNPLGWIHLLDALLNAPIGSGAIINVDEFPLGTIHEM
jgi:hypothetical protein